jgi:ATP-dependent DNA helicase DinG
MAIALKKPVLITTETINLQEQLVQKDLPILRSLMGLDFRFALAKGRGNYVCKRRLELARGDRAEDFLPFGSPTSEIDRIADWAESSSDGSRSDIEFKVEPQLWLCVCSEASNCGGPKCHHYRDCFYWPRRKEWEKARHTRLPITALFFVDLSSGPSKNWRTPSSRNMPPPSSTRPTPWRQRRPTISP